MKCPHCSASIGLFSKEMNELGKSKVCPRCGNGIQPGINSSKFFMAFFAAAILSILIGASGPIAAGIGGGVGVIFGFALKRIKT